jgi:hypothetical protein
MTAGVVGFEALGRVGRSRDSTGDARGAAVERTRPEGRFQLAAIAYASTGSAFPLSWSSRRSAPG